MRVHYLLLYSLLPFNLMLQLQNGKIQFYLRFGLAGSKRITKDIFHNFTTLLH